MLVGLLFAFIVLGSSSVRTLRTSTAANYHVLKKSNIDESIREPAESGFKSNENESNLTIQPEHEIHSLNGSYKGAKLLVENHKAAVAVTLTAEEQPTHTTPSTDLDNSGHDHAAAVTSVLEEDGFIVAAGNEEAIEAQQQEQEDDHDISRTADSVNVATDDDGFGQMEVTTTNTSRETSSKPASSFLDVMRSCKTLDCLRKAHQLPRREGQFNFPHALIVGWQKAATTSLYIHLAAHPDVIKSKRKEPEFFTNDCKGLPMTGCSVAKQERYIKDTLRLDEYLDKRGNALTLESSTHYGMSGPRIAAGIKQALPWTKIVISLREPISRAMSLMIHMSDPSRPHQIGCMSREGADMYSCLMSSSQLVSRVKATTATNTLAVLSADVYNYSTPLNSWLEAFPKSQLFLVQYEALTSEEGERSMLKAFKKFLNLNPALPHKGLGMHNTRKGKINPEGWDMTKDQYLSLIDHVKKDALEVARLAEEYGYVGSAQDWYDRWQAVWDANLDTCDAQGRCKIRPS